MMRRNLLVRLCGVGLLTLLGPIAVQAQTASSGAATGATPVASAGGGGVASGASAGLAAAAPLTTTITVYAASSGVGSATTIPSNSNFLANTMVNPYSLGLPSNYEAKFGAQNAITSSGGPKGKFTYLYVAPPAGAAGA